MTTIASEPTGHNDSRTPPVPHAVLPAPGMTQGPRRTPGSRLGPTEDFPEDLAGLGMGDLQVLHSRITRQLDHDYLTDPAGPHVSTMDRCCELTAELDARDGA
ncbi:hypothetical protein ACH9D2_10810 [Kocuria sp. M4R2S49]|uniref:hypothetical protein n=1 Tax=Kocuria rhizosphaericola TaxID=3376284 RepID=UPI0037B441E4